jgi:hypothetical protein
MATAATDTAAIHGVCDSRLQGLRDGFAENFAQGGEVGATTARASTTSISGRCTRRSARRRAVCGNL